jgi:DNA-directed RNA polymerase specialized sigma24 family protein
MDRTAEIDTLYRHSARWLGATVQRAVNTSDVNIDDACSHAWTQLLTHDTAELRTPRIYGWLRTVAIHEAYRLHAYDHHTSTTVLETIAQDTPAGTRLDQLESIHALLAPASDRQKRMIILHAAGHPYEEIAGVESASIRTVDRQLQRGRQRIRNARSHVPNAAAH